MIAFPGGAQSNAAPVISRDLSRFTTVATAGDSCILVNAAPGLECTIKNAGANSMNVFASPTSSQPMWGVLDSIGGAPNGTPFTLLAGTSAKFFYVQLGTWDVFLSVGFAGGAFATQSFTDGLTAHAGGGQNLAPIISALISRFTTVATLGDSTTLPVGVAGMNITIINAGANTLNVFPDTGSTINALGANAAFALTAGKTVVFATTHAGAWYTVPLVP
jgi:hypothetical protein